MNSNSDDSVKRRDSPARGHLSISKRTSPVPVLTRKDSDISQSGISSRRRKSRSATRRGKRRRSDLSSSVSDSDASSSTSSGYRSKLKRKQKNKKSKDRKKEKKRKKSHKSKKKKHKKDRDEKSLSQAIIKPAVSETTESSHKTAKPKLAEEAKRFAPMTQEQWEKEQSKIRKEFDEETGRVRLIRGSGEIIESIVSKQQHREINRAATKQDGNYFQMQLNRKLT